MTIPHSSNMLGHTITSNSYQEEEERKEELKYPPANLVNRKKIQKYDKNSNSKHNIPNKLHPRCKYI